MSVTTKGARTGVLMAMSMLMVATPSATAGELKPVRVEIPRESWQPSFAASNTPTASLQPLVTVSPGVTMTGLPGVTTQLPPQTSGKAVGMSAKLDRIAALEAGWWGPGSRKVPGKSVELVRSLVPFMATLDARVGITPHEGGMIVLEWNRDGAEFTVEILQDAMILTTDDETHDVYDEVRVDATAGELKTFLEATIA